MSIFNRMKTSWFPPRDDAKRKPRVISKSGRGVLSDTLAPTVDERTAMAAQEILENHSLTRVLDRLRQAALHEFTQSGDGTDGMLKRNRAYEKIRVLDDIETEIQAYADEMKLHRRNPVEN